MRYIFMLLLCACMLTGVRVAYAELLGTAVFVKQTGNAQDARADVYAQDVPGGMPRVLVTQAQLPPAFRGRIDSAALSADGAYLLLLESDGFLIRNPTTGAARLVLGSGYFLRKPEKVIEHFKGGSWIRERATGRIWRLTSGLARERANVSSFYWSPKGHLLLGTFTRSKTSSPMLRVFDPKKHAWRDLRNHAGFVNAAWLPHGQAVVSIERQGEKAYRIVETPLAGKSRLLLTRPLWPLALAVSPNGRVIALADARGCYLFSRTGQLLRNLPAPIENECPEAGLAFSPDGRRIGVLSAGTTGEPHIFHREELRVADVEADRLQRLAQWEVTFGSTEGGDPVHRLLGWTPDASALIVQERPGTGGDMEHAWIKLLLIPTVPGEAVTLFDSGGFVTNMAWQPAVQP